MKKETMLPRGLAWITPYLTVKDVAKAAAFYREAFGFKISVVLNGKDGAAVHSEMDYNGCTVMLGTHPDQTTGARPPKALGGTSVRMYIYSDDVDAMVAQAAKAGADICEWPSDQYWGERTGSVRDPEGHVWWIATPLIGAGKTDTAAALKRAADKGYAPQQP